MEIGPTVVNINTINSMMWNPKCCSQTDFKGTHNNGKDLLTNRNGPWVELQDLKRPFIEKSISKDLKGPWEP